MKNTEKLIPIEGTFTYDEAKEILMNLFTSKLNFHNIKNWSSNERFGQNDETSQKRIPELRKEIEKLNEIITEAKVHNKKLIVSSEISITLSDD